MSAAPLLPDEAELARWVRLLFKRADPAGWLALRVWSQADGPTLHEEGVLLGARDLGERLRFVAYKAANLPTPAVFAPPACTFSNAYWARASDCLEGPTLAVDADARPVWTLAALRAVLGPPTLVVSTGGLWTDPETGEMQERLHLFWRLARPARTAEEHQDLRVARKLACDLVASDASAVATVHPLRIAGSWHRKAAPRLARVVEEHDEIELDLGDTLRKLRALPDEAFARRPDKFTRAQPNPNKTAESEDVAAALAVIPNSDWSWDEWVKVGMAAWLATEGDWHGGFQAFDAWSAQSWKYDPEKTVEQWDHFYRSPPEHIGAGTLFWLAAKHSPGWIKPSVRFDAGKWHEAVEEPQEHAAERPAAGASDLFGEDLRTEPDPPLKITATPFAWQDPATFPRRRWLYGSHLIRKFVSCTVAPGGLGKSSLVLVEAIAMVTGRPLLGVLPAERPLRVWVINLEDPQEEIERRVLAILVHYRIDPAEVEGRLFIDSGRRLKVMVAEQTKDGTLVAVPVVKALREEIRTRKVDVVVIDPFVKAHRVPENDNGAIDTVCTVFAELADLCNCAFDLVHHVRKTNGAEVTVEDGRGAVALLGAVRSARALNGMSKDEAAKVGEGTSPREFFRVDNGKLNMAPAPPDRAEWFRLVSVPLGNGDSVGCVVPWKWPDAMAGVTAEHLRAVQAAVASGRWRENHQAERWVGHAIGGVLGLDVGQKAAKAKVLGLVKAWIRSGALVAVDGQDERRKPVQFVEVGVAA